MIAHTVTIIMYVFDSTPLQRRTNTSLLLALISLDGVEGGFLIDSEFSPGLGKHGWLKHSNILFWESFCQISGDEDD